jgi:hypothetical protein
LGSPTPETTHQVELQRKQKLVTKPSAEISMPAAGSHIPDTLVEWQVVTDNTTRKEGLKSGTKYSKKYVIVKRNNYPLPWL